MSSALQTSTQSSKAAVSPSQKKKSIGKTVPPTDASKSTSTKIGLLGSSSVARSITSTSTCKLEAPSHGPAEQCLSTSTPKAMNNVANEAIFRLAAATPVPISSQVERQFYESQLLLFVLEKIRGEHKKRQNYHGELDQDETELRRSFVDKLAYICDFKKGGSTVTALALQKTYQGIVFRIAANETVRPRVIEFLRKVLHLLKKIEAEASRKGTQAQLLALIVPFNQERLDYYWSALSKEIPLCIKRLQDLGVSTGKLVPNSAEILDISKNTPPHWLTVYQPRGQTGQTDPE